MTTTTMPEAAFALTDRQRRELEYHRDRAGEYRAILDRPFPADVIGPGPRRWWNAHWAMYTVLLSLDLRGSRCLVIGCGHGTDALHLARLGAEVQAFDLCPDSLDIAAKLATREGLDVDFREMPAERLSYGDRTFDVLLARDILHHVDIPATMAEMRRVSRDGARWVIDEIYSHSVTEVVRRSWMVERMLYPALCRTIYGSNTPYITADERKMNEHDVGLIRSSLDVIEREQYFDFLVSRVLPRGRTRLAQLDQICLKSMGRLGRVLGGRVLLVGQVTSGAASAKRVTSSSKTVGV